MDVSPLNFRSAAVRPVPPVQAASTRPQPAAPSSGVEERRPPVEPPRRTVGVEVARRPDGVQRLTFVDLRTGLVISETPPEQVLGVVDSIMQAIRRRESSDGQYQR
jgi:hypothetical protein